VRFTVDIGPPTEKWEYLIEPEVAGKQSFHAENPDVLLQIAITLFHKTTLYCMGTLTAMVLMDGK